MKKNRFFIVVILLFLSLLLFITSNKYVAFIMISFAIYLLLAIISVRFSSVDVETETYDEAKKNEKFPLSLRIKKVGLIPVVNVKIYVTYSNHFYNEEFILNFDKFSGGRGVKSLSFDKSGTYNFSIKSVRIFDLLGIFSKNIRVKSDGEIIIKPDIRTDYHNPFIGRNRSLQDFSLFSRYDESGDMAGVKDYVIGDNVKLIHWKLTGKLNKPVLKEYLVNDGRKILLIVDSRVSNEKFDDLIDEFFSFSSSLLEYEYFHHLAWLDADTPEISEVSSGYKLSAAIKEFMKASSSDKNALEYFLSLDIIGDFSTVVYFTDLEDGGKYHFDGEQIITVNSDGLLTGDIDG